MAFPAALEVCRSDLFTKEAELRQRFPDHLVEKVLRVREIYNYFISNPVAVDREIIAEMASRHDVSKVTLYGDLNIVKSLLPSISQASRDFHRWRYNEMILKAYKMAEKRKDTKTMERAASSYAKNNRVDLEDEQRMPYDDIVVQPFTATDDPSVLGIKPIPNIDQKIASMLEKYRAESADIDDVEFEEVDLEFDDIFKNLNEENNVEESIL
ncbi:MAG: hypothetical protein K2M31_07825 [Muribaculaceae bacterium]|nr:hypothetical protein [Muribaculaceae bacterium]